MGIVIETGIPPGGAAIEVVTDADGGAGISAAPVAGWIVVTVSGAGEAMSKVENARGNYKMFCTWSRTCEDRLTVMERARVEIIASSLTINRICQIVF